MILFYDPVSILLEAFNNLFEDKDAIIQYDPKIRKRFIFGYWGVTFFPDDGGVPIISVSPHLPLNHTIEIIAHELSHVAAGYNQHHNKVWADCFEKLHLEHNRITLQKMEEAKVMFSENEAEVIH